MAELLADCDNHGVRLFLAGDGGVTIDAPREALTPGLIGRLKALKAELLAILRARGTPVPPTPTVKTSVPADGKWHTIFNVTHGEYDWINEAFQTPRKPTTPRCRCHEKQRWWRSIYGDHLICGICHPPVAPGVLREWVQEIFSKIESSGNLRGDP